MSRKRKIWAVVSLAVALVVLMPLELRWRAQWRLNAYRKKLIAAGEKLTVAELAPKSNWQATNTALFLKLATALPSFTHFSPSAMLPIKPGVARVAWKQPRCMEKIDDSKAAVDVWPLLTEAMVTNQATLTQLQALVDAGGIEFIHDYSQPDPDGYSDLIQVRESVRKFKASAMLALHQGRRQEAFDDLKSCGTICQLVAKDSLMINQLVRYAGMSIAALGCWEALQAGGWTDEQLAQLQRQWDQSAVLAAAESSLTMERARAPMMFQEARRSRQALADLLEADPDSGVRDLAEIWHDFLLSTRAGVSELFKVFPRYWGWRWIWSYQDEERYLELMQAAIEATRDAQKRRSVLAFVKEGDESSAADPRGANNFEMAALMTAGNKRFVSRALLAQTEANMVTAAIALERFRLAHHAYPAALANLAPEFVQSVPVDCMDGHDLRYRLNPDGTYLLYSVGDDGVDNGGDARPQEGSIVRSWLYGRDLVWPRPATDEEVQAYEVEQNKPKAGTKRHL
jgi:hypothetical protein